MCVNGTGSNCGSVEARFCPGRQRGKVAEAVACLDDDEGDVETDADGEGAAEIRWRMEVAVMVAVVVVVVLVVNR